MYKRFKALGMLGSHLFTSGKNYFKSGGKKTKDIMRESSISRESAKADIKSEIKRKAFPRGGKKPSDFYNKPKGR
jgi:hypothetical protein